MARYYRLESLMNLQSGYRRQFIIQGQHLLLLQPESIPFLVESTCPHLGYSMAHGATTAFTLTCAAHGFTFDLRSGALVEPANYRCAALRVYELVFRGNEVGVFFAD